MIYPYRPYTSMLPKQAYYHKAPIEITKVLSVAAAQVHDTEFASTSYVNYSSMAVYILFTASRLRIGVAGLGLGHLRVFGQVSAYGLGALAALGFNLHGNYSCEQ